MFVHERARVFWKLQHIAGIAHGERECRGFLSVQAAEEHGHEERGKLVVGNLAGNAGRNDFADLRGGERLAVAFRFDERKEVHTDLPSQARNRKTYPNAASKNRKITIKTTQRCPSAFENSFSSHLGAAI